MAFSSLSEEVLRKKQKQLKRAFEELNGSAVIIVEGKKDRESLRRIGVRNEIVLINKSPEELGRGMQADNGAIILTDFDEAGEEKCKRVEESLCSYNIKADVELRRKLHRILGVVYFETIDKKLEEFEEEINKR